MSIVIMVVIIMFMIVPVTRVFSAHFIVVPFRPVAKLHSMGR